MTHSSTRKTLSNKRKDIVTIDLDLIEAKFDYEQPMVDNVLEPQKSPENTDNQEGNLALTNFSPSASKEPVTPKWLETYVERKRSMVPLSMPIDNLVSKCLGRASKVKKARTES